MNDDHNENQSLKTRLKILTLIFIDKRKGTKAADTVNGKTRNSEITKATSKKTVAQKIHDCSRKN